MSKINEIPAMHALCINCLQWFPYNLSTGKASPTRDQSKRHFAYFWCNSCIAKAQHELDIVNHQIETGEIPRESEA